MQLLSSLRDLEMHNPPLADDGGISSTVERYPVEVDVAGSNPVCHPKRCIYE